MKPSLSAQRYLICYVCLIQLSKSILGDPGPSYGQPGIPGPKGLPGENGFNGKLRKWHKKQKTNFFRL